MVIYLSSLLLLFTIFWSYLFINHLFAIRILAFLTAYSSGLSLVSSLSRPFRLSSSATRPRRGTRRQTSDETKDAWKGRDTSEEGTR